MATIQHHADHLVQVNAFIDMQGDSIGSVMKQGFGLGQIEAFDFGSLNLWLNKLR